MGKGIDLARQDSPEHAKVLDDFKDQLLIVLIKRLGGKVSIPIKECDNTGMDNLLMTIRNGKFKFKITKKH